MATQETSRPAALAEPMVEPAPRLLLKKIGMYFLLLVGAFVSLFPFYYMFVQASQPSSEVLRFPPHLWFGASAWANIRALWDNGFGRALFNSAFIAVTSSLLSVMIASMAGYAFAKYRFPGRSLIFGLFLLVLMVPYHVTAVPLFKMMASITWFSDSNWISSYQAVILPALANPFGIFLMRQSMQALPDDLLDAGRIDGASEWRVFWNVAIPTMRPTLAALGIYSFMFQWNSFFWPLIIMREKAMETLPVRINALVGLSIIDYGQLMMGTALTTLPIMMIFLAFQRQFISGAMAGAVKG